VICVAVTAVISLTPMFVSTFQLHVFTIMFYYLILAVCWHLLAGYAGRFSLAQQTFATIGAYTTGLLIFYMAVPMWLGIVAAALVAGLVGILLGLLVLRMGSGYLAMATWAFGSTVQILLTAAYGITQGQMGLPVPSLLGNLDPRSYFEVFLVLAAGSSLLIYFVVHSPVGLFLRSIKDDELRAGTLGVDTTLWKVAVFGLSSLVSGLAGAFYAHYTVVISPAMADFAEMGKIMAIAIVGGLGTFAGPIVGAPVVQQLLASTNQYGSWSLVIYAAVVIGVMRIYPGGLMGLFGAARRRLEAVPAWFRNDEQ
jgi:branched-chain amino acid transport system permease protein